MAETTDGPSGGTIASDASGQAAHGPDPAAAAIVPTPLDILARELLSIRALAAALLAMTDAALLTHELADVTAAGPFRAVIDERTPAGRNLADVIRRAGQPKAPPRTFMDRQPRPADDPVDPLGDVIIPPIVGGTA
jgi:hypothetical protein